MADGAIQFSFLESLTVKKCQGTKSRCFVPSDKLFLKFHKGNFKHVSYQIKNVFNYLTFSKSHSIHALGVLKASFKTILNPNRTGLF